jgi:hypothetical protein
VTTTKSAVGQTHFKFESIVTRHLPFKAETSCIQCGCPLIVDLGATGAVFRVGNVFIGISCDNCLTPESRARANELRAQKAGAR